MLFIVYDGQLQHILGILYGKEGRIERNGKNLIIVVEFSPT